MLCSFNKSEPMQRLSRFLVCSSPGGVLQNEGINELVKMKSNQNWHPQNFSLLFLMRSSQSVPCVCIETRFKNTVFFSKKLSTQRMWTASSWVTTEISTTSVKNHLTRKLLFERNNKKKLIKLLCCWVTTLVDVVKSCDSDGSAVMHQQTYFV